MCFRNPRGHRSVLSIALLCVISAIALVPLSASSADAGMSEAEINERLYQALDGGQSSPAPVKPPVHSSDEPSEVPGRDLGERAVNTVAGQLYLSEGNLTPAAVAAALDALLTSSAADSEQVAVRHAPRINFEIHFEKNTADLTGDSCRGLDALGAILQQEHLSAEFVLGGHTDMDGDASINQPLSQARAESARRYLIENYGIEPGRLEARGYGMTEPLHPVERSLREKQINRRVDLRLRDHLPVLDPR